MKPAPMTELSPEQIDAEIDEILAKPDDDVMFEELHRLYNYTDDDSRQFTRHQMIVAMSHGFNNGVAHMKMVAAALNATLVDENARLREALEFYAREHNWRSSTSYMCGHGAIHCNAMADKGAKARTALSHKETNR